MPSNGNSKVLLLPKARAKKKILMKHQHNFNASLMIFDVFNVPNSKCSMSKALKSSKPQQLLSFFCRNWAWLDPFSQPSTSWTRQITMFIQLLYALYTTRSEHLASYGHVLHAAKRKVSLLRQQWRRKGSLYSRWQKLVHSRPNKKKVLFHLEFREELKKLQMHVLQLSRVLHAEKQDKVDRRLQKGQPTIALAPQCSLAFVPILIDLSKRL